LQKGGWKAALFVSGPCKTPIRPAARPLPGAQSRLGFGSARCKGCGSVPYEEFERLSPNRDVEPPHEQLGVLYHHSELGFDETVALMLMPASKVSYHCLIGANGIRCRLVPDSQVAWHAGASQFRGRSRCNDFMLGVAFAGNTYRAPLTRDQIASALEWLRFRWKAREWKIEWIADHRQVSPGRKNDLNPHEWERLRVAVCSEFGTTT
jgi:AmpD protein